MTDDSPRDTDAALLSGGVVWLVRGIAISSLALPLALLEAPWVLAAPVAGPVGAVAVYLGVRQVVHATRRTPVGAPLHVLAALAVPLRVVAEVLQALDRPQREAEAQLATADPSLGLGDWVALATLGVTFVGVVLLAAHLRSALVGIASDRWRQVLFGWVAALVILPVALATRAVELLLLAAAVVVTAGALLILSLLATYRAAEDDDLDREFPTD